MRCKHQILENDWQRSISKTPKTQLLSEIQNLHERIDRNTEVGGDNYYTYDL